MNKIDSMIIDRIFYINFYFPIVITFYETNADYDESVTYLILLMDIASTDNNKRGWSCTALICGLMVIGLGLLFTHLFAEVFRK